MYLHQVLAPTSPVLARTLTYCWVLYFLATSVMDTFAFVARTLVNVEVCGCVYAYVHVRMYIVYVCMEYHHFQP